MQAHRGRSLTLLVGLVSLPTLAVAAGACGGSRSTQAAGSDEPVGSSDLPGGAGAEPTANGSDAGPPPDAAAPPSAVTFVLRNDGTQELALNMDRGWGGILLAWSGQPPKAQPILMFAKHCTASCDVVAEERCPLCEEPEKVTDIRAAQKLERIAPGASLDVPWDAQVFTYEKTRGKQGTRNKRCECWRTGEAAPQTYTVRACGLRLSTTVEKSSELVCAEGQMTLPVTEPARVELAFVNPPPKPASPARR